jgi:hypothetical protein
MKYSLDNIVNAGGSVYGEITGLYRPQLFQALLSGDGKKKLQDFEVSGTLTKSIPELLAFFESRGGKCTVAKRNGDYAFKWKEAYVYVDYRKKGDAVVIQCETLDPSLLNMAPALEKDFVTKTKKKLVFTIIQTGSGLNIESLGDGSSPLIKDNYTPSVLTDIDFVIESFKKSPPNGRIAILNGQPGTGKTHLIRSVLTEVESIFLIVPSNLIESLEKPDFMPLLLKVRNEHEKPIIMIIEDGDTCLVPRKNDNISTIASLLNLSDGILGSLIDIKMIISTNADIQDMDGAIMRPGRLCKRINIEALSSEQANRVYQRILKDDKAVLEHRKEGYTLAEIYHRANNTTNPTPETDSSYMPVRRVIGFQRSNNPDLTLNKK